MSFFVPEVAPMSRAQIEAEARRVVENTYPYLLDKPGPFPVVDFFEHDLIDDYDLCPGVAELPDGVEGMTFPDGRVLVSEETYRNAVAGDGRARMTLGHESYHGIRHRAQIQRQLVHSNFVLYRRQTIQTFRDPEWQAKVFASALLMPADAVHLLVQGTPSHLRLSSMVRTFGVSRQAAEVRLSTLGI